MANKKNLAYLILAKCCYTNFLNLIIIGFVPHCPGGDTCCTEEKKCHEYEGHCSSDDQCNKGLRCGINNCRKKRGLHYSDWNLNLNWIDNCCEKKGEVPNSIYMFKSFTFWLTILFWLNNWLFLFGAAYKYETFINKQKKNCVKAKEKFKDLSINQCKKKCDDDNECNFISIGPTTCKLYPSCDIKTTEYINLTFKKIRGNFLFYKY